MTRREFVGTGVAAALLPNLGCASSPRVGILEPWRSGELDIHFIHTGVGEQAFFVFPDGTTMLLDCGGLTARKPDYVRRVPPMPSGRLRGGEWVSRYIRRVTDRREIDYVMVSHWHDDHVTGIPDVARDFAFRHWLDHQYPRFGLHNCGADRDSLAFAATFIPRAVAHGMRAERFAAGALNQIALQNDSARRFADFEIRNLAANGVVWDGAGGTVDCGAEHRRVTGADRVPENQLSCALRIRYGDFTYYTGGDVEMNLRTATGEVDWEARVGAACGPVDVCKTNHHAYWDAMRPGFVRAIRAQAYLSSVWSPNQVTDRNLPNICSRTAYPGDRLVYHGFLPLGRAEEFAGRDFVRDLAPERGHIVVRVAPGGGTFRIFTLSAGDESMRVLACRSFVSRSGNLSKSPTL